MAETKLRPPAVAGQFYNATGDGLKKQIAGLIPKNIIPEDVLACMLPHAGYMYSGPVAAETVCRVKIKDKVVLLGPNHTGYGSEFSILTEGSWETPLGRIKIASALAKEILAANKFLEEDVLAHLYEHSLEVELPFLQYFRQDFEIVPITIMSQDSGKLKELGRGIAEAIKKLGLEKSTLLVASSDMTHYETQAQTAEKDKQAIAEILKLDENGLAEKARQLNISMCGCAPVIAMLCAAKELGAKKAKLIKYQTSGDITGDTSSVVGYAGITIY